MKPPIKTVKKLIVSLLSLGAFLGLTAGVNAQSIQETVNPTLAWQGYMNAAHTPATGGGDLYNNGWGTAALQADFLGATQLVLLPCTNVWETNDTAWVAADGMTPAAVMDANFYIQNDALVNTNIVFSGNCLSNNLTTQPEPLTGISYTCIAFIKAFNSSYGLIGEESSNMVAGQAFSISLNTSGASHVQYGFETTGPDANPATVNNLGFVVVGATGATVPTPTNAASTPTNTANVVAMYDSSGVYPEVPIQDWDASWSSAGEAPFTIPNTTNTVLKYTALSFAGVEFYDSNNQGIDPAGCNEMHVDVWTPNANQLGIELVSIDNNNTEGAQVNFTPASGTIVSNQWISLNIPLSQFETANPLTDMTNLQQLLWIDNQNGTGVVNGTFYIDNVYFYSNSTAPPPPPPLPSPAVAAPTPTTNNVLAMYDSSGVYGTVQIQDWDANWSDTGFTSYTVSNTTSIVLEYVGMQFAGAEFYSGADEQIDASSYNTMHVDVWTPNANKFGIQLVSLNPTEGGQVNYVPSSGTIVSNQWIGLDIPLSQFTASNNSLVLSDLQQLLWVDNQAGPGVDGGTFYIDNVYFYDASIPQSPPMSVNITNGTVNLSFSTEGAFTYTVLYTTDLTNPSSWQPLTSIGGNNYVQTVTDTPGSGSRFYRLSISQ